jgi:predicted alpha/beta hydrolase
MPMPLPPNSPHDLPGSDGRIEGGLMTTVKAERVAFSSEGVELAGEFRCADPGRKRPGVVLTGPFTGVKEQVTGTYASLLAEAGFATLAFDHRGFGESGGRPGHEDCQGKLADLRAARPGSWSPPRC